MGTHYFWIMGGTCIFKVLKEKTLKQEPYPAKLSFKSEVEIKTFPDKQKLKEFDISRPSLEEMLDRVLKYEMK